MSSDLPHPSEPHTQPVMPFSRNAQPPSEATPAETSRSLMAPPSSQAAAPPAPSRAGKVLVSGFFDPSVRRALKCLAIERSCSQQEVLAHALRLLFSQAIDQGSSLVREVPAQLQVCADDRRSR